MGMSLAIGTAMIGASVTIHTFGLMALTHVLSRLIAHLRLHRRWGRIVAMMFVVLGLFLILTVEVWAWAVSYRLLAVLPDVETALYFSTRTFATVGFGDVIPSRQWRLLTALEGIDGFLLIGWSTAYLVSAGTRVGPFRIGEHF
ncbi:ion channel [Aureimonas sp. D3]|uniref:ion channel n=1 Tax=Aureimonas sp. D3 TaxID=1638164 RepID=UPI000783EA48|nr:ion channel [Aureimonas sp. D3]